MALLHLNFPSQYLGGNTDVNLLLPDLPREKVPSAFYGGDKKYPVLWLLHGTYGDYSDWVRKTNVERYACEKELIVVMPSALNTDYANWPGFGTGYQAADYLTEELMPLVYGWLPASRRREDNFIAGLSMGGRGAIQYAYRFPEKFAAMYSMSCVPQDIRDQLDDPFWAGRNRNRLANTNGLEGYLASPQNTWDLTVQMAGRHDLPRLYFSCGTKDPLMYHSFCKFRSYAQALGLQAEFFETEGYSHEWAYWELCIQDAIQRFLPGKKSGGNSF